MTSMSNLIGKVPVMVDQSAELITMHFADGSIATWEHHQDCCEYVVVEDVTGDWSDLYGHPLLVAEERVSTEEDFTSSNDSNTWTFYTFRNIGGSVDVRWHGSSNGYYSEGVSLSLKEAA